MTTSTNRHQHQAERRASTRRKRHERRTYRAELRAGEYHEDGDQ